MCPFGMEQVDLGVCAQVTALPGIPGFECGKTKHTTKDPLCPAQFHML